MTPLSSTLPPVLDFEKRLGSEAARVSLPGAEGGLSRKVGRWSLIARYPRYSSVCIEGLCREKDRAGGPKAQDIGG